MMISVYVLALHQSVLASISDSRLVFDKANEFLKQSGRPLRFRVQLAGNAAEIRLQNGSFSIRPDVLLKDITRADLIIVPAITGDMFSATYLNTEYAVWLTRQYKSGAEVASLCSGAFLVAYAGILNGKPCTTHWQYANEFRYYYPAVHLMEEKILTDQNGLYSSGGSTAYWNLLLYLVEKYTDRALAIQAAKYFVIDLERHRQSPFAIFSGLKDHDDELVKAAQEYIEQHPGDKLQVDKLALQFNASRRTFERRFKKATYITVAEYIQKVKIESAKKQLEIGRKTINEIMYDIGYTDPKTFRDLFKKITDITPVEYRNKYKKVS